MRTFRSILTAAALTAATAGLSACGSSTPAAAPAAPATSAPATSAPTTSAPAAASSGAASAAAAPAATGTLTAVDQNSDGKSVAVASVDLKGGGKGGWIALHSDLNGKPGPVKYFVAVPDGASSNVTIPTPDGIPTGAYWPMLHIDDKVIGTYEFPQVAGADLPAMANGMIVMKKITVTVK
jgi:hypothetical protein